jgi:hypothetical protein
MGRQSEVLGVAARFKREISAQEDSTQAQLFARFLKQVGNA